MSFHPSVTVSHTMLVESQNVSHKTQQAKRVIQAKQNIRREGAGWPEILVFLNH